ncbi:restriction endonuclease subunit S [Streptomyces sp. MUM 203J]|uniref:restriction endonuclease subunit S n=1 Tax=Streptomyces sp. MUM 203J TaxID=2791990 RepID=UPI001F0351A9|nr:restriction endonuclease subunit S [Streptomyces sp. MUM 203J]
MSLAWDVRSGSGREALPPDWQIRRVGDLVTLSNGYPFPSESFGPTGDIPLVRIRDLADHSFETYVTGNVPQSALLRDGDVVIGMDGDFNLVVWDRGEAALNQRLCLLRPRADVDMRFIAYALPSSLKIINDLTFATTVKHLSSTDVLTERVMLPPLEGQRCIADFLDIEIARMDALATAERRVLDRLAERRAAGVVSAVAGGEHVDRRKSTLAWLETVPDSWQEVRVGLLAQMGSGHTPSRSHPEWWVDCAIPWITTGEVKQVRDDRIEDLYETREKISELGLANSAAELHRRGTVFLCRTASAGYAGVMGEDMATSQDFVTWTCGPRLNPYYLLWCLRAMRPDLLGRLAMGSTHKTIYVPDLQMLRIPLPPLDEQGRIVESIRWQNARIDVLVDKVRRQIDLLNERRQALITAAVTGQFDVSTASGRNVTEGITV